MSGLTENFYREPVSKSNTGKLIDLHEIRKEADEWHKEEISL